VAVGNSAESWTKLETGVLVGLGYCEANTKNWESVNLGYFSELLKPGALEFDRVVVLHGSMLAAAVLIAD
jgi:hypothetical protein